MRLFFALWPSEAARQQLAAVAVSCAQYVGGGRATRPETIHLTLAFLGEVPDAQLSSVIETGRAIRQAPFNVCVDRLGCWRHNRLLWAGCASQPPSLPALAEALRQKLMAAGVVFAEDKRLFMPHLTLVRKIPATGGVEPLPAIEPISWFCSNFVLVESQLTSTGSVYRTVAEFPLAQA